MSRDPWLVLRAVLETTPPGTTVTVDSWRDEADHAQLTSAEKGAAQSHAVDAGWLTPLGLVVDGTFEALTRRSTHPAGKGRRVVLFRRTSVGYVAPGQTSLFEVA